MLKMFSTVEEKVYYCSLSMENIAVTKTRCVLTLDILCKYTIKDFSPLYWIVCSFSLHIHVGNWLRYMSHSYTISILFKSTHMASSFGLHQYGTAVFAFIRIT